MDPTQFVLSQSRASLSLEYVLQGSIQDDCVHLLKARLQGLCDNVTGKILLSEEREFQIISFLFII